MVKLTFKANKKQKEAFRLLFDDTHTEIGYGGGAGGGKSYMGVAWCWMMCSKYPGTRYAFGRQELKRLKQTTLESYFKFLSDYEIPEQQKGVYNGQDSVIKFANGSQILLLDLAYLPSDPLYTRLGSLELTGAFVDEAAEVDERCITILSTRVGRQLNKKFSLPPKLLLTFNPDKGHVYRNYYLPYKNGTLPEYRAFVPALATDNEFIPDTYIEQLERSDEVTKQRLLYGNFEYDDTPGRLFDYQAINNLWNNARNDGEVYLSCDVARFGKDKTVIMLWKGWHIEKIIELASSSTVQVCEEIHKLQQLHSFPLSRCVVDEDGVGGGVVDSLGCRGFINNSKAISPANSNKVSYKKRNYKNLKTQCYFLLAEKVNQGQISIEPDYCKDKLVQELDIIVQTHIDDDTTLQIISKDEIKEKIGRSPDYSDACFISGTKVLTTQGEKNIEDIKPGEFAITPYGVRRINGVSVRHVDKDNLYVLNDVLIGTGNHKIYTSEGFKSIDTMMMRDRISTHSIFHLILWRLQRLLNTKERSIGFRELVNTTTQTNISDNEKIQEGKKLSIGKSMKMINEKYQNDTTYTILTEILTIMLLIIWKQWNLQSIKETIGKSYFKMKNIGRETKKYWTLLGDYRKYGTLVKKVINGIANITKTAWHLFHYIKRDVLSAMQFLRQRDQKTAISVVIIVFKRMLIKLGNILRTGRVLSVEKLSAYEKMRKQSVVRENVEASSVKIPVYDLEIDRDHCFYANGILVANCMMRCVYELTTRGPEGQVIQGKTELIDSFEIDDRGMLPEDMEIEETEYNEPINNPY